MVFLHACVASPLWLYSQIYITPLPVKLVKDAPTQDIVIFLTLDHLINKACVSTTEGQLQKIMTQFLP